MVKKILSYGLCTHELRPMSKDGKLLIKMTFKVTEEDRENFRTDVARLNKLLGRQPGDELDKSKILRAMIRDMHSCIQQGTAPQWLVEHLQSKPAKTAKAKKPPKKT